MRKILILIPSLSPAGPIKGAIALANGLAGIRDVTLISVKSGPGANAFIDPRVKQLSLAHVSGGWVGKLRAYQRLLAEAGGRAQAGSISMCFSADLINRFCRAQSLTCASVRGNLHENYKYDYGIPGLALALLHMQILKKFDQVTALSCAMAKQLFRHLKRLPEVIGNFVDEASLESFRVGRASGSGVRIVFVGNLSRRKQPDLAVKAMEVLGPSAHLDLIGDGPLRAKLEKNTRQKSCTAQTTFHGHLPKPWSLVAKADALVLPSVSEGIARAALEALYLGVPCVLRDVDGNRELIRPGYNGALFNNVKDLPAAIRTAVTINERALGQKRVSLLPEAFRQEYNVSKYLHLMEKKR